MLGQNNIETVKVYQSFLVSLPSVVLRSRTDKFEQKFILCADLVKALVWAAIILPSCLCLFDFFIYVLALIIIIIIIIIIINLFG